MPMSGRSRFDTSGLFLSVQPLPVAGSSGGCVLTMCAQSACPQVWMRIVQPSLSSQMPVGSAKAGAMFANIKRSAATTLFMATRLPQNPRAECLECRVRGNKRHSFDLSLRGQHSIERIAMCTGQKSRHARLVDSDGYRLEAMLIDDIAKRSSKCCSFWPFAETNFVGDFPGWHRADAGDRVLGRH